MTFQKYLYPLEIRKTCKNTQCGKRLDDLKRQSFKEANILFCSKKCCHNFYKYEHDVRKLHSKFINKIKVTNRTLIGKRGVWRIL